MKKGFEGSRIQGFEWDKKREAEGMRDRDQKPEKSSQGQKRS